jgi:hypothetical protein
VRLPLLAAFLAGALAATGARLQAQAPDAGLHDARLGGGRMEAFLATIGERCGDLAQFFPRTDYSVAFVENAPPATTC